MYPLAMRHVDVLLVEDNEADVYLTKTAFRDALVDTRIHAVSEGEEAIAFLKHEDHTRVPLPDLVLLDLGLPGLDGFQVLAEMKADPRLKKIPVIVVSGSDRAEDRSRAYELQAATYLTKPSDVGKYFTTMRQLKERWVHALSTAPKEPNLSACSGE